jgi:hypothetical protein
MTALSTFSVLFCAFMAGLYFLAYVLNVEAAKSLVLFILLIQTLSSILTFAFAQGLVRSGDRGEIAKAATGLQQDGYRISIVVSYASLAFAMSLTATGSDWWIAIVLFIDYGLTALSRAMILGNHY